MKSIIRYAIMCMFLSGIFAFVPAEQANRVEQLTTPVEYYDQTPQLLDDRWGNDVRIGNMDSTYEVELDIHRQTGNLFCALLGPYGNSSEVHVYFSSNSGANWTYKDTPFSGNFRINSVAATVVRNHFYVAITVASNTRAHLYRYRTSDGTRENFNNGAQNITVFVAPTGDTIREIALVSDQDFDNAWMNLFAITKNGRLRYFYSDTAGINWTESPATGVTNAKCGLDVCTNEGYSNYYALVTYITTGDTLQIDGFDYAGYRTALAHYWVGPNARFSAVGAYHDTIITTFEKSGYAVAYYIKYAGSNNGGSTWFTYNLTDTTTAACCPDIACRDHGGQGAVYAYGSSSDRRFRFRWRPYQGSWSTVQFGDYQPPNNIRPAIEYLGNGIYGTIYVSYSPIYGAAYFDRSDWTGITEAHSAQGYAKFINLSPNPSNGHAKLSYYLNKQGPVRISLIDISGRLVKTIASGTKPAGKQTIDLAEDDLPNGVYSIRLETPCGSSCETMVIVK